MMRGLASQASANPIKMAPIPCSPELAFRGLFGSVAGGNSRQAFDRRTNLLDFMADDVRRSRDALAGEERQRLDPYLEAFETLRDRTSPGPHATVCPRPDRAIPPTDRNQSGGHRTTANLASITTSITWRSAGESSTISDALLATTARRRSRKAQPDIHAWLKLVAATPK